MVFVLFTVNMHLKCMRIEQQCLRLCVCLRMQEIRFYFISAQSFALSHHHTFIYLLLYCGTETNNNGINQIGFLRIFSILLLCEFSIITFSSWVQRELNVFSLHFILDAGSWFIFHKQTYKLNINSRNKKSFCFTK